MGQASEHAPVMALWIPVLAALVGALAGVLGSVLTYRSARMRVRTEFATEQSAETAIRKLLELDRLPYRTFPMIRHHIGGFGRNELRRLLVRAGAVRLMAQDGTELWALRERVEEHYRVSRWKHPDSPQNKVSEDLLFPAAFGNPEDC
jgi:hypothetical protein